MADIINSCLSGTLDLSSTQVQSERLGDNPETILSELWEIAKNIDQLKGTQPNYELVSSMVCWHAAHRISNVELKGLLAFNLGRSFLFNNEPDQAQLYLEKAKGYVLQAGNRSRLMPILLTQAWLAITKSNQDTALELFRGLRNGPRIQ